MATVSRSVLIFQSTLPVWGATNFPSDISAPADISIHAPRVGSDQKNLHTEAENEYFNPRSPCGERRDDGKAYMMEQLISIHAPRVGSDVQVVCMANANTIFQSTLPVWGATTKWGKCDSILVFQSTLPVWGATAAFASLRTYPVISIHAPRVGSDPQGPAEALHGPDFNPRSPCGERPPPTGRVLMPI